ncbi:MAG: YigZ family protein [Dysgonamonadaceae bacterium]|jgi:uncharacterized YigZ family protein|nr:YigZ family protein [Dysgonamonadaceae bacterium]
MQDSDTYKTVAVVSEGYINEQRSKFISFALPVKSPEEVKEKIDSVRRKYYDATHVCWAYMLGAEHTLFRANDDGEPSYTAGKPILNVIKSNCLTDILIVVVRYFGGVKLGTGGLILAYRNAAQKAIENAVIIEKTVNEELTVVCEYPFLNSVMKIIKEEKPGILSLQFDNKCVFRLSLRKNNVQKLKDRLQKIETLKID